jgi:hypothetical protein
VDWGHELDTEMKHKATTYLWDLVNELMDRAPELRLSTRYRLMPTGHAEFPFVRIAEKEGFTPLFPAIAIPVEKKSEYECPEEQQALTNDLPKIDKVVTIGWRATEQHFMGLLKKHLAAPVRLLAVAGGRAGANEVMLQFILAGIPIAVASSSNHGFSDFVVSRELDGFLGY